MANIKWIDGSIATALSSGLNSLGDGSRAISSAIDNDAGLDLFCDLELAIAYTSSAPSAGIKVAEVYLIPTVDGTNFGEGSSSITPQKQLLAAVFESRNGSTSTVEYLVASGIPLPPRDFKLLLLNTSGKTLHATLNTLKIRPYKLQSV